MREAQATQAIHQTTTTSSGGAAPMPQAPEMPKPTEDQQQTRQQMDVAVKPSANTGFMARQNKLTGPNDPCHCGSGKKYKKCHMSADQAGSGQPGTNTLRG